MVAIAVTVVVIHACPQAILLAMITMTKSICGFPLFLYIGMGLRSAALWAARALLKWHNSGIIDTLISFICY